MSVARRPALALALACSALCMPGAASALDGCSVGQQVIIPGGQIGTVIAVNGAACTVRPNEGVTGDAVWSAFMLDSVDGTDPNAIGPDTAVQPGTYECYTTAGYSFVDIVITGPQTYEDRDGNGGSYSVGEDGTITYVGGTLAGHESYAKAGKVYLTAPGGDFYMTCDR